MPYKKTGLLNTTHCKETKEEVERKRQTDRHTYRQTDKAVNTSYMRPDVKDIFEKSDVFGEVPFVPLTGIDSVRSR